MTPSIVPASRTAVMSSTPATPPLAMTGVVSRAPSAAVASTFTPPSMPSRSISVWMMAAAPASSKRSASSRAVISPTSAQPSVATWPPLASMPMATQPG